eukprot:79463-Pyramimonas_sp.AAC.2
MVGSHMGIKYYDTVGKRRWSNITGARCRHHADQESPTGGHIGRWSNITGAGCRRHADQESPTVAVQCSHAAPCERMDLGDVRIETPSQRSTVTVQYSGGAVQWRRTLRMDGGSWILVIPGLTASMPLNTPSCGAKMRTWRHSHTVPVQSQYSLSTVSVQSERILLRSQ